MPSTTGTSKRKGGKKVKTGCMTCRARRVKCDETKPGCLRCEKLGQDCDGYEPGRRPMAIEKKWNITSMQSVIFPAMPIAIVHEPFFDIFGDEQEHRYFQLYQDHAEEVNGPFTSDFWTRLVLQASHHEESVRYAVVALGALQKTREVSPASSPKIGTDSILKAHNEFAFNIYQKAIVRLRESLESGEISPKIALIACILFVCFEIYHGDLMAALAQVLSGVRLLQEWKGSSIDDLSDLDFVSGSGASLDDQLTQIFAELDIQARTFMRVRQTPFPSTCPMIVEQDTLPSLIPLAYRSLEEARYSFTLLQTRTMRLDALSGYSRWNLLSEYQVEQLESHMALLNDWADAFAPILYRAQNDTAYASDLRGAQCLHAHWLMAVMVIQSTFYPEETYFDTHIDDFRQIVSDLRPIVEDAHRNKTNSDSSSTPCLAEGFTFEETTVTPLYMTATKCRDRSLRRQAIVLLQKAPRREGIFDSLMAAKIAQFVMSVEEEGVDEFGFVPEEARVRVSNVEPDMLGRRASITAGQKIFGVDGEFNVRKTEVWW